MEWNHARGNLPQPKDSLLRSDKEKVAGFSTAPFRIKNKMVIVGRLQMGMESPGTLSSTGKKVRFSEATYPSLRPIPLLLSASIGAGKQGDGRFAPLTFKAISQGDFKNQK